MRDLADESAVVCPQCGRPVLVARFFESAAHDALESRSSFEMVRKLGAILGRAADTIDAVEAKAVVLRAALVAADLALEALGVEAHEPSRQAISVVLGFEPAKKEKSDGKNFM